MVWEHILEAMQRPTWLKDLRGKYEDPDYGE